MLITIAHNLCINYHKFHQRKVFFFLKNRRFSFIIEKTGSKYHQNTSITIPNTYKGKKVREKASKKEKARKKARKQERKKERKSYLLTARTDIRFFILFVAAFVGFWLLPDLAYAIERMRTATIRKWQSRASRGVRKFRGILTSGNRVVWESEWISHEMQV